MAFMLPPNCASGSRQRERAFAVHEGLHWNAGGLEHHHVEIGQRFLFELDVLAEFEASAAVAGDEVGEVGGFMRARNLLSRPPHRGRSERGSVPGSEGVWFGAGPSR